MEAPLRDHDGFTLVEVLTALILSGIAVTIAVGIFESISQDISTLERRARHAAATSEGMLWFRDGLLAVDVSIEPDRPFRGTADSVSFSAWLPVAPGWPEPLPVSVTVERGRLSIRVGTAKYTLPDSLEYAELDYLPAYGASSAWLTQWESRTGAPLALRLRRGYADDRADTTLLYVGRGR